MRQHTRVQGCCAHYVAPAHVQTKLSPIVYRAHRLMLARGVHALFAAMEKLRIRTAQLVSRVLLAQLG